MSSTKNSNKRKNILDNSEVSSRKRQKISESIPATGSNDIEIKNVNTSKVSDLKIGEKSKELKVDDKIGIKTGKKSSKRMEGNEDTNDKYSGKRLVSKNIKTENKLKIEKKTDENDKGEKNLKKDIKSEHRDKKCTTEGVMKKETIQNAVVLDETNDIEDTQLPVELSLSDFFHIHMYIPSESKDSSKSRVTKDRKSLSSTKKSLSLSPSKSLRSIRCIETKTPEQKKVENSKVNNKRCSSSEKDLKICEKMAKIAKDRVSKSKKAKSILLDVPNVSYPSSSSQDNAVKASMDKDSTSSSKTSNKPFFSESLKITDSEGEKRIKSDRYESPIQKDFPKTSHNRTTSKKTTIQTESKRDVPVSQSVTTIPEDSLSTCHSISTINSIPSTISISESPSPTKKCANHTLPSLKPDSSLSNDQTSVTNTHDAVENKIASTDKQFNVLDISKIVEIKSSTLHKEYTDETTHSKHAIKKSANSNSVTDKIKSSKTDTILKQVSESPSTKDKRMSSNKLTTAIAITPEISQKDVSSTTKNSEISKTSSFGLSITNSATNKTKSSKPDAAVMHHSDSPSPQDEISSSINLTMANSNTLETSQSDSSASVTKSSEISKPCTSSISKDNNKTNKTIISEVKSLKSDKSIEVNESPSSQKKN